MKGVARKVANSLGAATEGVGETYALSIQNLQRC